MAVGDEWTVQWLRSRAKLGIRPGLERMQEVLRVLRHPERRLSIIHIAGTNGKGSVSAILTSLLRERIRVGVFTSPGTGGLQGKFEVVGEPVADADVSHAARKVCAAEAQGTPMDPLTEFEALTAMAFVYFEQQQVDCVVLEAGLGGRLDSTNVVLPKVSVITNVSLDHQQILGRSIREIAREKAGIIKSGIPIVTGAQDDALTVIQRVAADLGAPLKTLRVDFGITLDSYGVTGQRLTYRGMDQDLSQLLLPLYGSYQRENAALALATYEVFMKEQSILPLSGLELRNALAKVKWPGRFEVNLVDGMPVVLDGAHNPAGARALSQSLKDFSDLWRIKREDWVYVVGVLRDKDVDTMLDMMSPMMRSVIVCEPNNVRALQPSELRGKLRRIRTGISVQSVNTVAEAISMALMCGCPVCCWGSLYTVEEARKSIKTVLGDS